MRRRAHEDPELIALYATRKGVRAQLLATHDTVDDGSDDLPRVLQVNLSEPAKATRAPLWQELDYLNAHIRERAAWR